MAKKDNPEYKQLCGHIPKEKFTDFKKSCLDRGVDQSTALEQAVDIWLKSGILQNDKKNEE